MRLVSGAEWLQGRAMHDLVRSRRAIASRQPSASKPVRPSCRSYPLTLADFRKASCPCDRCAHFAWHLAAVCSCGRLLANIEGKYGCSHADARQGVRRIHPSRLRARQACVPSIRLRHNTSAHAVSAAAGTATARAPPDLLCCLQSDVPPSSPTSWTRTATSSTQKCW